MVWRTRSSRLCLCATPNNQKELYTVLLSWCEWSCNCIFFFVVFMGFQDTLYLSLCLEWEPKPMETRFLGWPRITNKFDYDSMGDMGVHETVVFTPLVI